MAQVKHMLIVRLGHVKELDLIHLYSNSMIILPRMSC